MLTRGTGTRRGLGAWSALAVVALAATVACQRQVVENRYFPLDAGRSWTYSVKSDASPETPQTLTVTSLGPEDLGGQRVTKEKIDLAGEANFLYVGVDDLGVFRYATQSAGEVAPEVDAARDYFLAYPLAIGKSWKGTSAPAFLDADVSLEIQSTVESADQTVRVGNRELEGCVKVIVTGSAALAPAAGVFSLKEQTWYAKDVGMVKSIVEESITGVPVERRIRVVIELQSFTS